MIFEIALFVIYCYEKNENEKTHKITKKRKIRIKMGVGLKKIHYSETDSEQKFLIKISGNFPVTSTRTELIKSRRDC